MPTQFPTTPESIRAAIGEMFVATWRCDDTTIDNDAGKFHKYPWKKHLCLWKELVKKDETDHDGIRRQREQNTNFNLFAWSGITVIDIDNTDGVIEKWEELLDKYAYHETNHPISNHIVSTPSGDYHVYFRHKGQFKTKAKYNGVGIDVYGKRDSWTTCNAPLKPMPLWPVDWLAKYDNKRRRDSDDSEPPKRQKTA